MRRYDDIIKELFDLSLEAQKKTGAFVDFDISNNGFPSCAVMIMDNGFEKGREFDGFYLVAPDKDDTGYVSITSGYEKAVSHLKRLTREADSAERSTLDR